MPAQKPTYWLDLLAMVLMQLEPLAVEPPCFLETGTAMEPTQLSADSLAAKPTSLLALL